MSHEGDGCVVVDGPGVPAKENQESQTAGTVDDDEMTAAAATAATFGGDGWGGRAM